MNVKVRLSLKADIDFGLKQKAFRKLMSHFILSFGWGWKRRPNGHVHAMFQIFSKVLCREELELSQSLALELLLACRSSPPLWEDNILTEILNVCGDSEVGAMWTVCIFIWTPNFHYKPEYTTDCHPRVQKIIIGYAKATGRVLHFCLTRDLTNCVLLALRFQ